MSSLKFDLWKGDCLELMKMEKSPPLKQRSTIQSMILYQILMADFILLAWVS